MHSINIIYRIRVIFFDSYIVRNYEVMAVIPPSLTTDIIKTTITTRIKLARNPATLAQVLQPLLALATFPPFGRERC